MDVRENNFMKNKATISALAGTWIAVCDLCGQGYENHAGSSPCCGSMTHVTNNVVTAEEQAEADAALLKMIRGANGREQMADGKGGALTRMK
jgi:hypothetical protein